MHFAAATPRWTCRRRSAATPKGVCGERHQAYPSILISPCGPFLVSFFATCNASVVQPFQTHPSNKLFPGPPSLLVGAREANSDSSLDLAKMRAMGSHVPGAEEDSKHVTGEPNVFSPT